MLLLIVVLGCGGEPEQVLVPPPTTLAETELVTVTPGVLSAGPLIAGTLEASRGATLAAELGGTIREVGPELGEKVAKGTLLARIDPSALGSAARSAGAAVQSARAQLEIFEKEAERSRRLVEVGAVPRSELETREAQVAAQKAALAGARAQAASARDQLGNSIVKAPLDGVIARRAVKVGDVVAPGALLYEVIDPSSLRLEAAVPADGIAALKIGMPVQFSVRGYPDRTFTGTVSRIAPAADTVTRQIPILVELPNPDRQLLAGLFAQGRLATEQATGLVLPASAIDDATGTPSVLRVNKGEIERVPVTLGLRDPMTDRVLVIGGLAAGDRVVSRAVAAPAPGTKVTTTRAQG